MYLDELLEIADDVSVAGTASPTTAVVGDVIDLGNDGLDGNSEDLYFVLQAATEIITAGAAGLIQFFLVSDSASDLGSATVANCTVHAQTSALVTDDAGANSPLLGPNTNILVVQLPRGTYERYLGLLVTRTTTAVTAGTVNAFLTRTPPAWTATDDNMPVLT